MIDQRKYGLEKIRLLNVRRKLMEKGINCEGHIAKRRAL